MLIKKWWRYILALCVAFLLVGLGLWLSRLLPASTTSPVPPEVSSQLEFSPLIIPRDSKQLKTSSYKYSEMEDGTKVLSYIITLPDGKTVTVSEYPQPSQFTDVPEYKDKFLTNVIEQNATVSTASGTISLGRMTKQPDKKQIGVIIDKGLVVFLNPSETLDEKTWRSIGDELVIQKR